MYNQIKPILSSQTHCFYIREGAEQIKKIKERKML